MKIEAQSHLFRRGIDTTAMSAGWSDVTYRGTAYYRYPVYAPDADVIVAYRMKALPGQTGAKYLWVDSKPAGAVYYRHPGVNVRAAVAAAGGVLWIANGEPSVLAYAAGGVANALSWFGEGSVPPTLAQDLQRLGVREVRYPADKDEAGRKSAAKVLDALYGTDITVTLLQWGDDVPEKGDANDLWLACAFDAAAFQRRLGNLETLNPTPRPPAPLTGRGNFPRANSSLLPAGERSGEGVSPDLIAAIAARLNVTGFRANGWSSKNILSPFRDEQRASAAFNRDSGVLHDFGSGESYSVRDVAERLGIDRRQFRVPGSEFRGRAKEKFSVLSSQFSGRANPTPWPPAPLTGRGDFTFDDATVGAWRAMPDASNNGTNLLAERIVSGSSPLPAGERSGEGVCVVNQRWTSELDPAMVLAHRTILLRAPMATGKTELVKRLIYHLATPEAQSLRLQQKPVSPLKQADHAALYSGPFSGPGSLEPDVLTSGGINNDDPKTLGTRNPEPGTRILYINHLKSLTAHAAERLGLELYDNIPAEFLPMASSMAISYNSLHKLLRNDGTLPAYDLLVVDECEQVQPYIGASTFRPGEAVRNYGIFRALCAQSQHVLFMDAHAGEINAGWLRDVRGDCQVMINEYRHDWGRLELHESYSSLVSRAIALMHLEDGPVVIPTNSRSFSETLYHHLRQVFGADGILLVNSENSESAAVQYTTVHINEELPKLRALICSPSYSTGLDVTAQVRAVCGIFFQQPTLPSDNLQMMGRYRNASERHAYVQPCERELITDEAVLYRHEIGQSMRTAVAADFAAYDLPAVAPDQSEILRLQCRYEAAHNRQRVNMLLSFVALAQAEGYTLAATEGENITLAVQLKASKEAVAEARKQRTLDAEPVTHDMLATHRRAGTLTPEVRAGHERYLIEDTVGLTLTPALYDRFRRPADRRALRRYTDLTLPARGLQERDRLQASGQVLIRGRSHYTEAQDVVRTIMNLLELSAKSNFTPEDTEKSKKFNTETQRHGEKKEKLDEKSQIGANAGAWRAAPDANKLQNPEKSVAGTHGNASECLSTTNPTSNSHLPANPTPDPCPVDGEGKPNFTHSSTGKSQAVYSEKYSLQMTTPEKSSSPLPAGERSGEGVCLREAEIETRAGDYIRANIARIQRVIDHRYDLSAETLPVVKRILKSVGLALRGKQVMVNRERFYVYWLDADAAAAMAFFAESRRAHLAEQEPVTQNTRMAIRNTRILSNSQRFAANFTTEGTEKGLKAPTQRHRDTEEKHFQL